MSSSRTTNNATTVTAYTGTFQNLTSVKGSVYGTDGNVYTKLPVGANDDVLTMDSTKVQGLTWKPYFNPITPTVTFNLFSCIAWRQNNIYYCSWGTNPPSANHRNPNVISFNFDTYVIALGLKPRATDPAQWATPYPSGMWTGFLNLDILGWVDGADPNTVAPTIMTPAAPHFPIQNTSITTAWMPYYSIKSSGTEIFIPARTKFCIRSSWNTTASPDTSEHFGTGNIVLRGVPS